MTQQQNRTAMLAAGLASDRVEIIDARRKTTTPDFHFFDHGSVCTLTAVTDAAKEWADDNLPEDRQIWGAFGTVIEPRYVDDIIAGITGDGLIVR